MSKVSLLVPSWIFPFEVKASVEGSVDVWYFQGLWRYWDGNWYQPIIDPQLALDIEAFALEAQL